MLSNEVVVVKQKFLQVQNCYDLFSLLPSILDSL